MENLSSLDDHVKITKTYKWLIIKLLISYRIIKINLTFKNEKYRC
jgi:hypothetical protein